MKVITEVTTRHSIELLEEEEFEVTKRRTGKQVRIRRVYAKRHGNGFWNLELAGYNVLKSGETGAQQCIIDRYNYGYGYEAVQALFAACPLPIQQELARLGVDVDG